MLFAIHSKDLTVQIFSCILLAVSQFEKHSATEVKIKQVKAAHG